MKKKKKKKIVGNDIYIYWYNCNFALFWEKQKTVFLVKHVCDHQQSLMATSNGQGSLHLQKKEVHMHAMS